MNLLSKRRDGVIADGHDVLWQSLSEDALECGEEIISLLRLYLRLSSAFVVDEVVHHPTHLGSVPVDFIGV